MARDVWGVRLALSPEPALSETTEPTGGAGSAVRVWLCDPS